MTNFVALDFETANPDLSSICQVGIACFSDGQLKASWESLVNPGDYFHPVNISIHGITEEKVKYSPKWSQVYPAIADLLRGNIVISHTPFDRVALHRACERADIQECNCKWIDSARVVRHTWSAFARSGYGLTHVAAQLGIEYRAHNALEDARCAGEIMLRALAASGFSIEQWLVRAGRPIHATTSITGQEVSSISEFEPNPTGPLFGEVMAFTGTLTLTRYEAAAIAAAAGCTVAEGVTKHTTLLVVGNQDVRTRLAGHEKSSKQRKAEDLILRGHQIRILTESDFKASIAHRAASEGKLTSVAANSLPVPRC